MRKKLLDGKLPPVMGAFLPRLHKLTAKRKLFGSFASLLLVGGFTMWQVLPAAAAQGSLVGYWKFDESTAGSTAADSSGNSNNLTPVNSPVPSTSIPSGMNNGISDTHSASFNGSSQYFSIPDNSSLDSTSAVTISTWVKFNSITGNYQTIVSKWNIGVAQQWTLQLNTDNHIGWWTGNGGTAGDDLESSTTISSGSWYHVVATSSGSTKKLYINGTLDSSKTNSPVTMGAATSVGLGIGGKAAGSVEYLNGYMDDTRLYSRVLNATEASDLASGNEANLLTGSTSLTGEAGSSMAITDLQITSTLNNPTISAKLFVSSGTISLSTTSGLTFYNSDGTTRAGQPSNSASLQFGGTLSDMNTALASLHYTRTSSSTGTDTLSASLVQPGQVFFSGNNHLYQYVAGPVSWTQAKSAALASTLDGAQGYLATITSQAENDFIQTQLQSNSWIGASDDSNQGTSEGNWIWTNGPESGQQFWQGNGSGNIFNSMYAHWDNPKTGGSGAEPNNSGSGENCAEFYYSNNGLWNDLACTSTLGYIIEYGAPGNLPTVVSQNVAITTSDTTAPTVPGTPSTTSPTTSLKPSWSWSAATDGGTGLANPAYTVQWSQSSSFSSGVSTATTNSTSYTQPSNLSDGTWYFHVKATDVASNASAYSSNGSVVIDTTGPSAPDIGTTTIATRTTPSVLSWNASSDGGTGLANPAYTVQWSQSSSFSSGVNSATTNSISYTTVSLSQGTWYFRIKATDVVSNASAWSNVVTIVYDTTAPSTPGTPNTTTPTNNPTPSWSWTASTDNGSGLNNPAYTVQWSQSSSFSSGVNSATTNTNSFAQPSNLADGTWYFRVKASDAAGNDSSYSSNGSVAIDTAAPAISLIVAISNGTTGELVSWTTDKQSSSRVQYGPTITYGSTTALADTSPRVTSHTATLSGLVACTLYHFTVTSVDALTNSATSSDNSFITSGCAGSATVTAHADAIVSTAAGGSLSLSNSGSTVSLDVPTNFAGADADFQIKKLDADTAFNLIGTPTGLTAVGTVYDIKAMRDTTTAITSFNGEVTVTMNYTGDDLAKFIENSLVIYRWDSGPGWQKLNSCSINTSARTVTCTTPGFSTFALFGQPTTKATTTTKKSTTHVSTTPQSTDTSTTAVTNQSLSQQPSTHTTQTVPTVFGTIAAGRGTDKAWYAVAIIVALALFWWILAAKRRSRKSDDTPS